MNELITVVMPAFNAAATIEESIASLQAQTYPHWQLVVVDDGSSDTTCALVERIAAADPRVRLLRQPMNGGPAAARNRGVREARGRYVAFLDADDLWRPEKLSVQVPAMGAPGLVMSYHDYRHMTAEGNLMGEVVRGANRLDWVTLHKRRGVGCLSVMVDLQQAPDFAFPERLHGVLAEDFLAWANLLRGEGRYGIRIAQDLALYRLQDNSRSSRRLRAVKSVWVIYRQFERIPVPRAAWFFACYLCDAIYLRLRGRPRQPRA